MAIISTGRATRVVVGVAGRVLFYPSLLYNIVRNQLEPEYRWWDAIGHSIVLGAVPFPKDVEHLKALGVQAVVTLNEAHETLVPSAMYKECGMEHLQIPTRDYMFAPSDSDLQRAVDFIHEHEIQGKKTYVHCKAGRGRSTTVVLCYLVEHKGMTPPVALDFVRARRPRVLLVDAQWQAVKQYYRRLSSNLRGDSSSSCEDEEDYHCVSRRQQVVKDISAARDSVSDAGDSEFPVLGTPEDLEGYRDDRDAGFIGNDLASPLDVHALWRVLQIHYIVSVRQMGVKTVSTAVEVAKASAALARLSVLWIGRRTALTTPQISCTAVEGF